MHINFQIFISFMLETPILIVRKRVILIHHSFPADQESFGKEFSGLEFFHLRIPMLQFKISNH